MTIRFLFFSLALSLMILKFSGALDLMNKIDAVYNIDALVEVPGGDR